MLEVHPPPDARPKFFQKLLAAQNSAQPVAPTGSFAAGPLKGKAYVSDRDTTSALTPLFRMAGLVLTYSMVSSRDADATIGKDAKKGWLYTAVLEFTLTDPDTGYSQSFLQEGRALTDDNRGPVHAVANASRVFLQRILLVPVEDDQRATRGSGRQSSKQQPQGNPVPGMADGRDRRIAEARGLHFKRQEDGSWIITNGPEAGEELDLCLKCQQFPRIQVRRGRFLCIDQLCGGVYVDPIMADLQEAGAPPPPPPPTESRRARNVAEEIRIFRKTVDDMVERVGLYTWQLDAVVQATPELPDDVEKWALPDWLMFTEALQKDAPNTIKGALAIMAKRTPAGKERIGYLESLFPRLPTSPVEMMKLRLEADAAAKSGWHDAVQELIESCEKKLNQGELPMASGQKARAR